MISSLVWPFADEDCIDHTPDFWLLSVRVSYGV
jgi:hypothetical protein